MSDTVKSNIWSFSMLVVISICGFQEVGGISPRTQNVDLLLYGEGSWFMNQTVKFRSHSLVPRALFTIFTEPLTASTCTSFVVIFPGMIFKCSVRVFFLIPAALTTTGIISAFFNFYILMTSFFRSWYLVIFLISVAFSPMSLRTETLINNADFSFLCLSTLSGHNALFAMSTLDGIILSYVSIICSFSRIGFGLCVPWLFSDWDVVMFTDVQVDYSTDAVMSFCVQLFRHEFFLHPKRRWLVLSVSNPQNLHLSDLLNPAIFLKALVYCPWSWALIMTRSPSYLIWPLLCHSNEPSLSIPILSSYFVNIPALLSFSHLSEHIYWYLFL